MLSNGLLIPNRRYPRLTDADVGRLPKDLNFFSGGLDMGGWFPHPFMMVSFNDRLQLTSAFVIDALHLELARVGMPEFERLYGGDWSGELP